MTDNHDKLFAVDMAEKPTAAFEVITVAQARILLQLNTHNRKLNDRLVKEKKRSILAGNFMVNGETIKLSWPVDVGNDIKLPILLDGQHRLTALVAAGEEDPDATIEILVVRGLDPASQSTMDGGRKRSGSDVLRINGEKETAALASILVGIWKLARNDRMLLSDPKPTSQEQEQLLAEHPEIRRSLDMGLATSRGFPALKKTSLGIAHYFINEADPQHAPYFFRLIATGTNLAEGHPVLALRTRATSYRLQSQPMTTRRELGLLFRAWNKCVENASISRLTHDLGDPIPDLARPLTEHLPMLTNAQFADDED